MDEQQKELEEVIDGPKRHNKCQCLLGKDCHYSNDCHEDRQFKVNRNGAIYEVCVGCLYAGDVFIELI